MLSHWAPYYMFYPTIHPRSAPSAGLFSPGLYIFLGAFMASFCRLLLQLFFLGEALFGLSLIHI